MKAEAMSATMGMAGQSIMVRAHAGLPARKSSLANILEDRQGCAMARPVTVGTLSVSASSSSHRIFAVLFSPLSSCSIVFLIPQRSLAFNGKLVQNKGYEAWNSQKLSLFTWIARTLYSIAEGEEFCNSSPLSPTLHLSNPLYIKAFPAIGKSEE